MFDEKTIQKLNFYVYMLIDPFTKKPFYVGKGFNNRVFNHLECACNDLETISAKYDKIREINKSGQTVGHIIVRHGLTEFEAFQIEASLIDSFNYCGIILSNIVNGQNSIEKGLMTSEEIIRLYNAEQLNNIENDCILININKKYKRGSGRENIYNATKETWTLDKNKLQNLKYALSEYKGFIVEVFEIKEWYQKERGYNSNAKRYGQIKLGFGFNGEIAPNNIRIKYINKSIAHLKNKSSSAIRYNL